MRRVVLSALWVTCLCTVFGQSMRVYDQESVGTLSVLPIAAFDSVMLANDRVNAQANTQFYIHGDAVIFKAESTNDTLGFSFHISSDDCVFSGLSTIKTNVLTINPNALLKVTEDICIRDSLVLKRGKINLNNADLYLNKNTVIPYFDSVSYVYHTGDQKGYFSKSISSNQSVSYPVGTDQSRYTPIQIENNESTIRTFKVKALELVKEDGENGSMISISNSGISWDIDTENQLDFDANVIVQSNMGDEKNQFNKDYAFISRYTGISGNIEGDTTSPNKWSIYKQSTLSPVLREGNITTSDAQSLAWTIQADSLKKPGLYAVLGYGTNALPLPVELTAFDGKWMEDGRSLYWETASEINNAYFTLIRKTLDQEEVEVAQISSKAAGGNSTNTLRYEFIDNEFIIGSTVFYQLHQTDFDGTTTQSDWIQLTQLAGNQALIFPNPSRGIVYIQTKEKITTIEIIDAFGRVIPMEIQMSNGLAFFDMSGLRNGIYTLQINQRGHIHQTKIVKH